MAGQVCCGPQTISWFKSNKGVSCAGAPAREHTPAAWKVPWSVQHRGITHALTSRRRAKCCSVVMTMVCGDMGLGMRTWSTFAESYLDVPQNGLPHMHWPRDAEHVLLGAHDNNVRGCGAHVLSMQDHPCGTTTWQANPRSPVQRCMPGAELLRMAECATPCGNVTASW